MSTPRKVRVSILDARRCAHLDLDWNPTTYEQAAARGAPPGLAYAASKKLAEAAAWGFAKEHGLELVALNPPMVYGPALQESATSPKALNMSTGLIYQLFSGAQTQVPEDGLTQFCDVRGKLACFLLLLSILPPPAFLLLPPRLLL